MSVSSAVASERVSREGRRRMTMASNGSMDFRAFMLALSKCADKPELPIEPCIEQGSKHFAQRKEQVRRGSLRGKTGRPTGRTTDTNDPTY